MRLLLLVLTIEVLLLMPRSIARRNYPEASFSYTPEAPLVDELVTFNASLSKPNGGAIVKYVWDFGDNTGVTESDPVTSHAYAEAGTYNVTLGVIDSEGLWDTESRSITIYPLSASTPTASFTYSPTEPLQGETITFDASESTDSDGTIVKYRWNFGDNTTVVEETDSGTTHTYTTAGTYNVTLTVIDNDELSDSTSKTIKIFTPGSPRARFTYEPENPVVNQLITFNASLSTPNGGAIVSYFWDFGDQTNGTGIIAVHNYTSFGYYHVNLTVSDSEGYSDSISVTLKVNVRDVSIIGIASSANEVYSGQLVNITVIVRNHGTTPETFNVTLYYQDKALATQVVKDLAPGAQQTLTFSWNTEEAAPDFNYTITAKASVLPWEIYTDDNTYIDGTVKVTTQTTSQPFGWSSLFPYVVPISLGLTSFVITVIIWKKRRISLKPMGFEYFNELTHGGIPEASSVMIIGGTASGKSILCQELAHTYLTEGKACIYVTYDSLPDEVRKNMQNFHWDVLTHEKEGTFILIDSYSSIAGKKSQEKHMVEQPFVLSDLGIAISTAFREVKEKSPRVFIDSATPLFMHVDAAKVLKFLQDRIVKIKSANGILFFTVGEGTVPPDLRGRLEEIVDCVIELKLTREKEKVLGKLCVRKIRGRESSQMWVPIRIEQGKGLTFLLRKD
jgi:PKD repeat protein